MIVKQNLYSIFCACVLQASVSIHEKPVQLSVVTYESHIIVFLYKAINKIINNLNC